MGEKQSIGRYQIVSELGRGGMGVVFKAWEESLQRFVAIKMLGDQLTEDESLVARFLREARAVADLNHPNVVQVFAVDKHEGRPYFAMEYVEGESLTELIRTSRRIDPDRAIRLLKEVATGLGAAHDKGVVHRDIKPDNIMLTKHGGVKVVDFGVAKVDDPNTKLTATGIAVGTPNYVSPEVCLGLEIDNRSDLFSLGVVFYEMLTGDTPFNADSPLEMLTKVAHADVPDVTAINPQIDARIRMILNHLLEKKPENRYQDAHQLLKDIDAYANGTNPAFALEARNRPTMQVSNLKGRKPPEATEDFFPVTRNAGPGKATLWVVAAILVLGVAVAGTWMYMERETPATSAITEPSADTTEPVQAPAELTADSTEPAAAIAGDTATPPGGEPANDASSAAELTAIEDEASNAAVVAAGNDKPELPPDAGIQGGAVRPDPVSSQPTPAPATRGLSEPRLVVLVNGDAAVASAVESVLENALQAAGFGVIDERFIDGVSAGADLASLRSSILADGGNIMVVADVVQTGQRALSYAGRSDTQVIANLEVRAVLLEERRNLGAPWTSSLQYVALNAGEQARTSAEPIANELVARLHDLVAAQSTAKK
jgi:predicted Ser/Thr protein kinase